MALLGPRPVHPGPVCPPVVASVSGLGSPIRVVHLSDFVAHPDHRDAAPAHDHGVRQEQPADDQVQVGRIGNPLEAGQAGRGPADPPVTGLRIGLEDQTGGGGSGMYPRVVVGEEGLVPETIQADRGRIRRIAAGLYTDLVQSIIDNADFARLWSIGLTEPKNLTEDEWVRFVAYASALFRLYESSRVQWLNGRLDEEHWRTIERQADGLRLALLRMANGEAGGSEEVAQSVQAMREQLSIAKRLVARWEAGASGFD